MVADVITSGTLLANLIKAGILSDAAGRNFIDMETGAFNFGDKITYDPVTGQFRIDGALLVSMISGQSDKLSGKNITLDGNTTVLGTFSAPGSSIFGTIDAQTINVTRLNADNLNRGTVGTSVSNTSGTLRDGWKNARIDGSATGINANSSVFFFDYAKNAFISEGRITARPEGNSHHLELNGLSLNTGVGSASMKVWSSYVQMMGHGPFRFETGIEANQHVRLLGKDIALGSDGNVKWS